MDALSERNLSCFRQARDIVRVSAQEDLRALRTNPEAFESGLGIDKKILALQKNHVLAEFVAQFRDSQVPHSKTARISNTAVESAHVVNRRSGNGSRVTARHAGRAEHL